LNQLLIPKARRTGGSEIKTITTSVACQRFTIQASEPANSLKMKSVSWSLDWLARRNRTSTRSWVGDSHHWEVTAERLDILRDADLIVRQEIKSVASIKIAGKPLPFAPSAVWCYGRRTYAYPIVLRLVSKMVTADWARVPYDLLEAFQPYCQKFAASTGWFTIYV